MVVIYFLYPFSLSFFNIETIGWTSLALVPEFILSNILLKLTGIDDDDLNEVALMVGLFGEPVLKPVLTASGASCGLIAPYYTAMPIRAADIDPNYFSGQICIMDWEAVGFFRPFCGSRCFLPIFKLDRPATDTQCGTREVSNCLTEFLRNRPESSWDEDNSLGKTGTMTRFGSGTLEAMD